MRVFSMCLTLLLLAVPASTVLAQDSLDVDVRWVVEADSTILAGAGASQGVGVGSRAVVYVPFFYQGAPHKNRVARGLVISTSDSTSQVRLSAMTAPVRPGYRILFHNLRPPAIPPVSGVEQKSAGDKKPFYKRKWFWPVVGAAVATTVIVTARGGSSSNLGTVSISGSLP